MGSRGRRLGIERIDRLMGVHPMAADGLITLRSSFGPKETLNRFEAEIRAKGMMVFAHIDHAAGATFD